MSVARTTTWHWLSARIPCAKLWAWAGSFLGMGALCFWLAITPFWTWELLSESEVAYLEEHQVGHFLTSSSRWLVLLLVGAACCAYTIRAQRGQADRFTPAVLIAMIVGVFGGAAAASGTMDSAMAQYGYYPLELFRLAMLALAISVALALFGFQRLAVRRKERGVGMALGVLIWSGGWLVMINAHLVNPAFPKIAPDEISTPSVPLARLWHGYRGWLSERMRLVSIDARGGITVDGDRLESTSEADVVVALSKVAQGMIKESEGGAPDEVLFIACDAQARFSEVAKIIDGCMSENVGIWRIVFVVQRERPPHPNSRDAVIYAYLRKPQRDSLEAQDAEVDKAEEREESTAEDELLDVLVDLDNPNASPPIETFDDSGYDSWEDFQITLRANSDARWQDVVQALSDPIDYTGGDVFWYLMGVEVLD